MIKTQRPYFFFNINSRPVQKFKGTKTYVSTGDSEDMENGELVTFYNRPSRANVEPKVNDVIFAKMANTDKTFLIDNKLANYIFSTGFFDISSRNFEPRYLAYLVKSDEFDGYKNAYSEGTTQISISDKRLKKICITYETDIQKQKQIADFLDEKVKKINKLIALYRNKISEFNIYKLQLISETICFGFHEKSNLKINKNIWIPKIPYHWTIKRAKYVFDSLTKGSGITKEQVYENGDTQCIRYGEIYTKYNYSFSYTFSKTYEKEICPQKIAHYGDILFAGTGELINEIGKNVVYLGDKKLLVGGDIIIGKHHHNPIFLNLALICPLSQEQKSRGKSKLKVVHISASEIGNILLPVPPLEEQNYIAEYLNRKIKTIEKIIDNYDKKINTLGDYKKSLIYEYVSGKKEVSL